MLMPSPNKHRLELGDFHLTGFRRVLAVLHQMQEQRLRAVTSKQQEQQLLGQAGATYPFITLDFSQSRNVGRAAMAALVADVTNLRRQGANITVTLPIDLALRNAFLQLGWAYYLDPEQFSQPGIS